MKADGNRDVEELALTSINSSFLPITLRREHDQQITEKKSKLSHQLTEDSQGNLACGTCGEEEEEDDE